MKGPFLRLRYDMHRAWECQSCHAKVSTPGTTTTMMCDCGSQKTGEGSKQTDGRVSMKMVGDGLRRIRLPFESDALISKSDSAVSNTDSTAGARTSANPDSSPTETAS